MTRLEPLPIAQGGMTWTGGGRETLWPAAQDGVAIRNRGTSLVIVETGSGVSTTMTVRRFRPDSQGVLEDVTVSLGPSETRILSLWDPSLTGPGGMSYLFFGDPTAIDVRPLELVI